MPKHILSLLFSCNLECEKQLIGGLRCELKELRTIWNEDATAIVAEHLECIKTISIDSH
jgi:hypothetical protein